MAKVKIYELIAHTSDAQSYLEKSRRIADMLPKHYYVLYNIDVKAMKLENFIDIYINLTKRHIKDVQWGKYQIDNRNYYIVIGKVRL